MKRPLKPCNFSCDKGLSPPWAFVIEEDAVASEHAVSLAVVDHHPVGVQLGNPVGRSDSENYSQNKHWGYKLNKIFYLFYVKIKLQPQLTGLMVCPSF